MFLFSQPPEQPPASVHSRLLLCNGRISGARRILNMCFALATRNLPLTGVKRAGTSRGKAHGPTLASVLNRFIGIGKFVLGAPMYCAHDGLRFRKNLPDDGAFHGKITFVPLIFS